MKKIYKIHKLTQAMSFILFLSLLLATLKNTGFPTEIYLRLSPLLALSALAASRTLIPGMLYSLIVIILTVFLGRVFCSWICPLGFVIDTTDNKICAKKRKNAGLAGWSKYKYILLLFVLIVSIAGFQITGWFDPISLITRTMTTVIIPFLSGGTEALIKLLYRVPFLEGIASFIRMNVLRQTLRWDGVYYQGALLISIVFIAVILISRIAPRMWCRSLCPLGALLALFSAKALNSRKVSEKCSSCNACTGKCPMGAISGKGKETNNSECIKCFRCADVCPENAVSFAIKGSKAQIPVLGVSRKQFILTSAGGVLGALFFKATTVRAAAVSKLLRPPGVESENDFISGCVRCGECMQVCPTGALQPALMGSGAGGLWTPCMDYDKGYCDYDCNACSRVCPVSAISKLELAQKKEFKIGRAYFNINKCLPWAENENCIVCEEMCPIPDKAIRLKEFITEKGKKILRPYVVEDKCIGCGICQNKCPLDDGAAVKVFKKNRKT